MTLVRISRGAEWQGSEGEGESRGKEDGGLSCRPIAYASFRFDVKTLYLLRVT
jgi:hypothetical protein